MKTVIIGNGILGLTTALRLAAGGNATDKIVVIGKKSKPGCATAAAGAMLASFCEIEDGSFDSEIDRFHFELSYQATRMWPQFILDHLDIAVKRNCLIAECADCQGDHGACYELGTYLINNCSADSLDDSNFNAVVKALKEFYEPYIEVDPQDIPNYKPQQRHRAQKAIYIPNEGWLNPKLTMRSIEVSLENFDTVEFIDAEVETLIKNGNLIESVALTDGSRILGDKFLLASGATASDLIDRSKIGISIPRIFSSVGVSIHIRSSGAPHVKPIRTPNRGMSCGLYTVPFYTGPKVPLDEIVIGSGSFVSPVRYNEARVGAVQFLLTSAMEQINSDFYRAEMLNINIGSRPLSADTYPVIGKTSIPNFIIATGTRRDGFHLSPLISEVLVKLLHDEEIDSQFKFFKPERELNKPLTREKAIDAAVKNLISASYQHGFEPSHDRIIEKLRQAHRNDLEALHDKMGAKDWGIPVDLLDMYRYGHIAN